MKLIRPTLRRAITSIAEAASARASGPSSWEMLSARETIGVSEFIISWASTRTRSCQAFSSTADSSADRLCSEISRQGRPPLRKPAAAASMRRWSASRTMMRAPGASWASASAAPPRTAMSASRTPPAPQSSRAARLAIRARPPPSTMIRAAVTVSARASNSCRRRSRLMRSLSRRWEALARAAERAGNRAADRGGASDAPAARASTKLANS